MGEFFSPILKERSYMQVGGLLENSFMYFEVVLLLACFTLLFDEAGSIPG